MSHSNTAIDCRGLGVAIAVLRIKQAIHDAPDHALPLRVHLGDGCERDEVAFGLRAMACDVRLLSDGVDLLAQEAVSSSRQGLNLTAHV